MPGPCSAPNGNEILTHRHPANQAGNMVTGKTALKKGKIERPEIGKFRKQTRARYEQESEE